MKTLTIGVTLGVIAVVCAHPQNLPEVQPQTSKESETLTYEGGDTRPERLSLATNIVAFLGRLNARVPHLSPKGEEWLTAEKQRIDLLPPADASIAITTLYNTKEAVLWRAKYQLSGWIQSLQAISTKQYLKSKEMAEYDLKRSRQNIFASRLQLQRLIKSAELIASLQHQPIDTLQREMEEWTRVASDFMSSSHDGLWSQVQDSSPDICKPRLTVPGRAELYVGNFTFWTALLIYGDIIGPYMSRHSQVVENQYVLERALTGEPGMAMSVAQSLKLQSTNNLLAAYAWGHLRNKDGEQVTWLLLTNGVSAATMAEGEKLGSKLNDVSKIVFDALRSCKVVEEDAFVNELSGRQVK